MRKFLLIFISALLVFLGCSKKDDAGMVSRDPNSIVFWVMNNAPDDVHMAWLKQKTADFEAETGVKVYFEEARSPPLYFHN